MNNFCNLEYLQERLAAVCKERDELRQMLDASIKGQETLQKELHETKSDLQKANARLEEAVADMKTCCDCCSICGNTRSNPLCEGKCEHCQQDCKCKGCDEKASNFVWRGTEGN